MVFSGENFASGAANKPEVKPIEKDGRSYLAGFGEVMTTQNIDGKTFYVVGLENREGICVVNSKGEAIGDVNGYDSCGGVVKRKDGKIVFYSLKGEKGLVEVDENGHEVPITKEQALALAIDQELEETRETK